MYTDWKTLITIRRNTRDNNHRNSQKLSIEKEAYAFSRVRLHLGLSKEKILSKYSVDEYEAALASLKKTE